MSVFEVGGKCFNVLDFLKPSRALVVAKNSDGQGKFIEYEGIVTCGVKFHMSGA